MNIIIEVLAIVGFCSLFCAVAIFGNIALDKIENFIYEKKVEYQYKHRFDKPPKAKCYCYDCVKRDQEGRCSRFNWWVREEDFCSYAAPRMTMDEVKRNE